MTTETGRRYIARALLFTKITAAIAFLSWLVVMGIGIYRDGPGLWLITAVTASLTVAVGSFFVGLTAGWRMRDRN
jgi:ABC-type multidrug transport system permease subunit